MMVTVLVPLVWPTPVCMKLSRLGWKFTDPGVPPVPLSATLAEGDWTVIVPV